MKPSGRCQQHNKMVSFRAAHALVWALALALLASQAMAVEDMAASAPWPGSSRNQEYVLPARPSREEKGAPRLPAAQSALAHSYAAVATAEAPNTTPKFRLPPRPRSWGGNFSVVLAELQAGGQPRHHPMQDYADGKAIGPEASPALSPGSAQPPASATVIATAGAAGFVTTSGTNFVVDGKIKFFSGTSAHNLLNRFAMRACIILKLELCMCTNYAVF